MFMTEPLETKTLLKGSQNNNHDNEEIIGKQEGLYESKKQNVKPDFKRRQINNEEQSKEIIYFIFEIDYDYFSNLKSYVIFTIKA